MNTHRQPYQNTSFQHFNLLFKIIYYKLQQRLTTADTKGIYEIKTR